MKTVLAVLLVLWILSMAWLTISVVTGMFNDVRITIGDRHEAEVEDLNAPQFIESQRQQDALQEQAQKLLGLKGEHK